MKKGFTAIILALLMAVSLLSCSDRSGNNEESIIDADNIETAGAKEVTETETAVSDDLPELSFEKDFNIFSPSVEHCASYIFSEEMDGDNVNDAKYEMHTAIEQRFGITVHEEHGNTWFPAEVLRKLVASGDSTYDISFCQDNVSLEHLDLAYCLDNLIYLDLDKPYWDKGMNDACRISGKAYFAYGAYHMSHYDMTHILAFSKGLIDSLSLENPYDLVRSGAWTIDKLFKMGTTATFDVDGDGVMTSEDSYGFVSTPKQILPCFWIAFGERTIIPDKSEIFILNESEHFFNTLIKTFEVMRDGGIWCVNHEGTQTVENLVSMFGTPSIICGSVLLLPLFVPRYG